LGMLRDAAAPAIPVGRARPQRLGAHLAHPLLRAQNGSVFGPDVEAKGRRIGAGYGRGTHGFA